MGVGVTKTSDNPERVRSGGTPPNPELSTEWTRTDEFEVAPYEEFVAEGFFSEPGAYYIECRVDGGELKALWLPFYASQTAEVRGQYLILDITDDGRLSLYTSGYD